MKEILVQNGLVVGGAGDIGEALNKTARVCFLADELYHAKRQLVKTAFFEAKRADDAAAIAALKQKFGGYGGMIQSGPDYRGAGRVPVIKVFDGKRENSIYDIEMKGQFVADLKVFWGKLRGMGVPELEIFHVHFFNNDAVAFDFLVQFGRRPNRLEQFNYGSRHLLPAGACKGSPSRAQYLAGQPRDQREDYKYNPDKEGLYREAFQKLQEENNEWTTGNLQRRPYCPRQRP